MTFQTVVKTIARQNGIFADFSPKPLENKPGNGFHINISVKSSDNTDNMNYLIAGILDKISDMTIFLNPTENSYKRFGKTRLLDTFHGPVKIVHSLSEFLQQLESIDVWNSALRIHLQIPIWHLP